MQCVFCKKCIFLSIQTKNTTIEYFTCILTPTRVGKSLPCLNPLDLNLLKSIICANPDVGNIHLSTHIH